MLLFCHYTHTGREATALMPLADATRALPALNELGQTRPITWGASLHQAACSHIGPDQIIAVMDQTEKVAGKTHRGHLPRESFTNLKKRGAGFMPLRLWYADLLTGNNETEVFTHCTDSLFGETYTNLSFDTKMHNFLGMKRSCSEAFSIIWKL